MQAWKRGGCNGQPTRPLRSRLDRALVLFERVLKLNPTNYEAMWFSGKIHQRLGDHTTALAWFERAYQVNLQEWRPSASQPDTIELAGLREVHGEWGGVGDVAIGTGDFVGLLQGAARPGQLELVIQALRPEARR